MYKNLSIAVLKYVHYPYCPNVLLSTERTVCFNGITANNSWNDNKDDNNNNNNHNNSSCNNDDKK